MIGGINTEIEEKFGFEYRNKSKTTETFGTFGPPESHEWKKMEGFESEYFFTGLKFSSESKNGKLNPVVAEKLGFEYQNKSNLLQIFRILALLGF